MNDSTNSSKGLLVLRYPCDLSQETASKLTEMLIPTAEALGVEPLVLGNGADARIEMGTSMILSRIADALERIAAQGEPPTVSEAEIVPQSLNARPSMLNTALNSRDILCKGSWALGTACGKCSRCKEDQSRG